MTAIRQTASLVITRGSLAYHAGCQAAVAEMAIALAGVEPHLDSLALAWSRGERVGAGTLARLSAAHYCAGAAEQRVTALAAEIASVAGVPARGLDPVCLSTLRAGCHLTGTFLAREIVAKAALGVDLDEQPRWG